MTDGEAGDLRRRRCVAGPEMCGVGEERRDALANYDYDAEDLEPLDGNDTTSQCARNYRLLVAFASESLLLV